MKSLVSMLSKKITPPKTGVETHGDVYRFGVMTRKQMQDSGEEFKEVMSYIKYP